jgi:putative ubiquitin-RnfH superfamily antitoxin RatB of RatAB toxin-antitoxin module
MLKVELVYVAINSNIFQVNLTLKPNSTVEDALIESRIYEVHSESLGLPVGIFAKKVGLDTVLKDGDRVEIYRPLVCDPKEKRRHLARKKKVKY